MRVVSFIGPNATWAFTADDTGGNLPVNKGPWRKDKRYNIHRGQKLKIAVNADWIIDAATVGGYYLTKLPPASENTATLLQYTGVTQYTEPMQFALQ